jgi:hypothetical protein
MMLVLSSMNNDAVTQRNTPQRLGMCQVGSSQLIFQDLTIKGFWLSTWLQQHSEGEFNDMLRYLIVRVRGCACA